MSSISEKVNKKLENGRQFRNFTIGVDNLETREDGNNQMVVEGYATIFNAPYLLYDWGDYKVNEQVDARAFSECDMSDVIMQYNHEGRVFARISNDTLSCTPDDKGLKIRAVLGGTEIGRQLYEEIKGGYTTKMSFGFTVDADERKVDTHKNADGIEITEVLRTITKIGKLYDVSAVSIPANDATEISARSYCEGVIAEIKQELLEAEQAEQRRKANINKIKILAEVNNGI